MKRRIHLWARILAVTLILGQRALAESPFTVDVWSTEEHLPQSSVIALTQTRDGYMWVGTQNGLSRFDGNAFTTFNVNNTPGLPGNVIVFLYEDSRTNLWACARNGALCLIQNGALRKVFDVGDARGKITAAYEDKDGSIWFATDGKDVIRWHDGTLARVTDLPLDFQTQLSDLALHVFVPARDGGHWLLKNLRVKKMRGDQAEKDFGAPPWGPAIVTAACEDDAGNLVVGTRGAGVFWFDAAGGFQQITRDDGLSANFVLSFCFDSEKNLWVGTDGGGLDRVRQKIFNAPAALSGGVAQSISEDAQGGLWTTFNLRGLTYWTTNTTGHMDVPPESAWTVLVDHRQLVWAGTIGASLYAYVGGTFQPVANAWPAGQKVFALYETREGTLLMGADNGLAMFDGQRWTFPLAAGGLTNSPVRALAEDTNGAVWVGTETDGLFQMHDGKVNRAACPINDISTLLATGDGGLWAGSFDHGLARRSPAGDWKIFSSTASGLANDDIGSMVEDDAGNLWLGSYEGIVRVEKRSIADVLSGAAKTLVCRTFLTRECSAGAQPAAIRTHDGRLWFPTTTGVVSVNPAALRPNTNPPPVFIESVAVDGVDLNTNRLSSSWNGAVQLTPANEQLDIYFASLNFSAPKGAQFGAHFRYRLFEAGEDEQIGRAHV